MRADVDGDGRADRVRVLGHRTLVAVLAGRVVRVTLPRNPSEPFLPALGPVANLDGRPGDELLVDVQEGACAASYAVVTYRRGRLVRLHAGGVWDAFTAVSCGIPNEALGCAGPGVVAVTGWNTGRRMTFERTLYRTRGLRFVRSARVTRTARTFPRWPELSRDPFARCR